MIVGDLVKRKPVTSTKDATLAEIARLMKENEVGSVVIVDERMRPVGIITERDVVMAIADGIPVTSKAERVMSGGPVQVNAKSDITEALALMLSRNIRHLVVVNDEGVLVGVVSSRDLLRAVGSIALDLSIW